MRFLQDTFLVSADEDANSVIAFSGGSGLSISINRMYDKYGTAVHVGTVESTPYQFTEPGSYESVKKGDTVLFHHFVAQADNTVNIDGQALFMAKPHWIWALVENNTLKPLGDWCFVRPIEDTIDEFVQDVQVKFADGDVMGRGILEFASDDALSTGLKIGSEVYFMKGADYSVQIGDSRLFRMKYHMIVASGYNADINPERDYIMIEEDESHSHDSMGLIMPLAVTQKEYMGQVKKIGRLISCVKPGEKISYFHNTFTPFYFDGKKYAILKEKNLIYKQL